MEVVREQAMQLVLNTDVFPYHQFLFHKLAQVLEISEHHRSGKLIAVVWECDNRALANLQAELLWKKGLPVRMVGSDDEREQFLTEMVRDSKL